MSCDRSGQVVGHRPARSSERVSFGVDHVASAISTRVRICPSAATGTIVISESSASTMESGKVVAELIVIAGDGACEGLHGIRHPEFRDRAATRSRRTVDSATAARIDRPGAESPELLARSTRASSVRPCGIPGDTVSYASKATARQLAAGRLPLAAALMPRSSRDISSPPV